MRPLSTALALACLACSSGGGAPARRGAGAGTGSGAPGAGTGGEAARRPAPAVREEPRARVIFEVPGIGDVPVRVEIARTPATRARGLMYRRELALDAGMLFVYPSARVRSFWMRNTYLPLDMIFVGRDRRVVDVIEQATPLSEESRVSEEPAQYVVEVHGGFARAHGIFEGVTVRFEDVADALPGAPPVEDDPVHEETDEEMEPWIE